MYVHLFMIISKCRYVCTYICTYMKISSVIGLRNFSTSMYICMYMDKCLCISKRGKTNIESPINRY